MPDLDTLCFLRAPDAPRLSQRIAVASRAPQRVVVVHGSRGAPLERIAREIHAGSPQSDGPIVVVTPDELETEGTSESLFAQRRGGSIVLAHLDRASRRAQLAWERRVRAWRRANEAAPRVFALFHSDPRQLVAGGSLLAELFDALDGLSLRVAPLHERKDEIAAFARARVEQQGEDADRLSADAVTELERLPWPGEERELELWIDRALHLAGDGPIEAEHVRPPTPRGEDRESAAPASDGPLVLNQRSLEAVEAALIERVLAEQDGNVSRCAEVLGIHRSTLHAKLRALRLR